MENTFKNVYIALLTAIGIVLHIIESYIPVPLGLLGAKLGLTNIVSLLAIVLYGLRAGVTVSIMRTILGSLISGTISSIPYSLSGAFFSVIVMWITYKYLFPHLSLIGISVLGSAAFNVVQVLIAAVIIQSINIIVYLPILLIIGTATGCFIGIICNYSIKLLKLDMHMLNKNGGNNL